MNIPCENPGSLCTDPSTPIANISSEAADFDAYFGRNYGTGGAPSLGGMWISYGCVGMCSSTISQEDADACAQQQQVQCVSQNWPVVVPNPSGNQPGQPPFITTNQITYFNTAQSCSFTCPDGSKFIYTVPANTYSALSLVAANNIAYSTACNKAVDNRICIGDLAVNNGCLGDDYDQTVTFTTMNPVAFVTIISGSLPPGLVLTSGAASFTIAGPLSGTGDYVFSIQVEDNLGNFMQKSFRIYCATIANTSLSDGVIGDPYSETLLKSGTTTGSLQWSIASGALPPGLSLNSSTGAITGTPTLGGDYTFTVQMQDGF